MGAAEQGTSTSLLDRWLHVGDPACADRTAVATRTAEGWDDVTYAQLDRRAASVTSALGGVGVQPGDRVALLCESGAEWTAAFFGIVRRGAVAVLLDGKLTPAELGRLCQRSELTAAVVSPALASRWGGWAPLLDVSAPVTSHRGVSAEKSLREPAVLVWTSGTTGDPKGVTLSLANLAYVVTASSRIQATGPDARWLSVLPPNHLLELCCGLLPGLAAASTTFVARTIVPHELLTLMAERDVNQMVVVPLVLRLLKRHLETTGASLPTGVRAFYCGGAPLDPEILRFFLEGVGVAVFEGYGLTEASPTVSMNSPGHSRVGSVGLPLPGTDVRVTTDGEILVRGPQVMLGYWNAPDATRAAVDADGWLHTGDLGRVDEDGYLFVTGRAKSLIVLESGKKVQPEEVETALSRSELFAETCVVGLPGDNGCEQVCVVVVPATPLSLERAEEEVGRLTADLSPFKRPTVVRVHTEELPKSVKRSLRRADVVKMLEAPLDARAAPADPR